MDIENTLVTFYSKALEKAINEKMVFYSFNFPYEDVNEYIHDIIDVPIREYIEYIKRIDYRKIDSSLVFQYSSYEDITSNITRILIENDDPGYSYLSVGKLLLNDGLERKKGALVKYGENHSKASYLLGLTNIRSNYVYLSCLGKVFNDLNDVEKQKLISRLVLRCDLIINLIKKALLDNVNIKDEINFLSDSTIKRRRPNIKKLIKIVYDNADDNTKKTLDRINFN